MPNRFVAIWFRHLVTDWLTIRKPALQTLPFVFVAPDHGRIIITAANRLAEAEGACIGMVAADARAIIPLLQVFDDQPKRAEKLLHALAAWCIRFTPVAAIDLPDGIILDVSGCAHLWGGERPYLKEIIARLRNAGYDLRAAMADTIGTAWAIARYGQVTAIIETGTQANALLLLPAAALRLPVQITEQLQKLGLYRIGSFMHIPRTALRRRFGEVLLLRIDQALGRTEESLQPVVPLVACQERLPCPEPITTAIAIEIALKRLLQALCKRLQQEEKGLRAASFKAYRADGKTELVEIGTHSPSHHADHLFKLFEPKMGCIEPALGIELFILEATKTEDLPPSQQQLWAGAGGVADNGLTELLDRLANRVGTAAIHRYLPAEHYWPERSVRMATSLHEKTNTAWQTDRPRPVQLLAKPEPIEVTAPVPDYPPMLFRYKGKLHTIKKADGPERIEREWWLEDGPLRDYYCVEDEEGRRYWLFRSGHYAGNELPQWFIHGFFA